MKQRLIFIVASTLILAGICFQVHRIHCADKSAYIDEKLVRLSFQIEATVENLRRFSQYVHEVLVDTPEIGALMEKAWQGSKAQRAGLRQRLYEGIRPAYEHLLKFNFRQLHFTFPDNHSFLRMHAPDEFGDDLSQTRISFRLANETRQPVSGFEEGKIYNGYRFVYPVFHEQRHCGVVEVSFSMASFLDILACLESHRLRFIIKRSVVEDAVFAHHRNNYRASALTPDYLYDKGVYEAWAPEQEALFAVMGPHLTEQMEMEEDFGFVMRQGGLDWLILFKSLRNIEQKHVAYIVSACVDTEHRRLHNAHVTTLFVLIVAFAALQILVTLVITERQKLKQLSSTDTLTRLANRNSFIESATVEMERARRYGSPLSVLILDIDNFKSINDSFGHNEGDRVLRNTAALLRSNLRSMDKPARWGGEEFVMLLPGTDLDGAVAAGSRLCSAIAAASLTPHRTVTASIGASGYVSGESLDDFVGRADTALYRAKNSGKNRVEREPAA
ncbi:MAG: diguanylate cyclase [Desulfosarcinaceae bacterium]